jgi:hypothetical protein
MGNKKLVMKLVVLVLIVLSSVYLLGYKGLFSTTSPLVTTPSWRFVHGCSDGDCSSSMYNLGDLNMKSSAPIYLKDLPQCKSGDYSKKTYTNTSRLGNESEFSISQEFFSYPSPSKECWIGQFTFDGVNYNISAEETISLNEYISITYTPSGQIYKGEVCHPRWRETSKGKLKYYECKILDYEYDWQDPEWESSYTFKVTKPFLSSKIVKYTFGNIKENILIDYSVENKLTKLEGGSVVRQESVLFSPEKINKEENFNLLKKVNYFSTEGNSDTLGDLNIRIQPFAIVYNKIHSSISPVRIYDSELTTKARVLPNVVLPEDEVIVDEDVEIVEDEEDTEPVDNKNTIMAVLAVLIVIGGFIYLWQKGNK